MIGVLIEAFQRFLETNQMLGIFRQSANYRKVKDLKPDALDSGESGRLYI